MPYHLTEQYRQKIDECIAMAKGSTSNKVRAHHYKTPQRTSRSSIASSCEDAYALNLGTSMCGPIGKSSRHTKA
jgi:hypothetical protein